MHFQKENIRDALSWEDQGRPFNICEKVPLHQKCLSSNLCLLLSVVWKIRVSSKIQSEMDLTKSEIDLPKKYESQPQMIWKADYLG